MSREIKAAQESVDCARRACAQATKAARDVRTLERRLNGTIDGKVAAAQSDLQRRLRALSGYRAGSVAVSGSSGSANSSMGGAAQDLGKHGVVDVPLSDVRFDDNPIIDGYHKGGASETDYRWAVETWHSVVRPGVLGGATREAFERRDAARGASEFRRTAAVHDMFLGDDRLLFSRRSDGSLDVANGRHRVQAARSLGISYLPGRIT